MSQYSAAGVPLSPSTGWTNGGLNHPQGVAVDQKGNVWIANNYGPQSAPGQGNVVVYPGGDPSKAFTISGSGLNHPFAVQIDGYGRAWVTNAAWRRQAREHAGRDPGRQVRRQHYRPRTDFKPVAFSPIQSSSLKCRWAWPSTRRTTPGSPATSAARSPRSGPAAPSPAYITCPRRFFPGQRPSTGPTGFGWPASPPPAYGCYAALTPPRVRRGHPPAPSCSPKLGFQSAAFQHFTSIQVDQSGNIWLSNNWSKLNPPTGGVGIAEIVGSVTPVCTPLTPVPVRPSSSTATACARQTATPLASLRVMPGRDVLARTSGRTAG